METRREFDPGEGEGGGGGGGGTQGVRRGEEGGGEGLMDVEERELDMDA